jgi:hypothetical protein
MPIRINGGVFCDQMLTGSLAHYVITGADFSGAMDSFGQPVPNSAAEIIFTRIEAGAYVDIMNPNEFNLSFALESGRSLWDEVSLTALVRSLGTDVGVDHINCLACTVTQVPYIWGLQGGATSFIGLSDTPASYAGAAGYNVTVNSGATGLVFTPATGTNSFTTIDVNAQPSIIAAGSDTLTFVAGSNVVITTDSLAKTIKIDASGGSSGDYLPVSAGTILAIGTRYFVTNIGTVYLPESTGAGYTAGQSITISKKVGNTVFVNTSGLLDIIATDIGNTNILEFDATQEVIFVFDGVSTWNLQIGSAY